MQKSFSVGESITDVGKLFHNLIAGGKNEICMSQYLCKVGPSIWKLTVRFCYNNYSSVSSMLFTHSTGKKEEKQMCNDAQNNQ